MMKKLENYFAIIYLTGCAIFLVPSLVFALDFKGIEIGKEYTTDYLESTYGLDCFESRELKEVSCTGDTTIASNPAKIFILQGASGKVKTISVDFSTDNFDSIAEATLLKFGKPQRIDRPILQNALNAKFRQISYTWYKKGNSMNLSKYNDTISEGNFSIYSKEFSEEVDKNKSNKNKDI